jgi:hypothetical protein
MNFSGDCSLVILHREALISGPVRIDATLSTPFTKPRPRRTRTNPAVYPFHTPYCDSARLSLIEPFPVVI